MEVLEAVNVELPGDRLAVPDIAVADADYVDTDPSRYPPGTVRAVVEIVSPSTRSQDRVIKPRLYAAAGIPVYWRVELEGTPHVIVSELRRGRYVQARTVRAGERATVEVPFPVSLDPAGPARQALTGWAHPGLPFEFPIGLPAMTGTSTRR